MGHIVGFLAVQQQGMPAPNGFTILWYPRNADGRFSMQGFIGSDPLLAAESIRELFDDRGIFPHEALYYQGGCGGSNVPDGDFETMQNGLALSDPLQAIAVALSPQQIALVVQGGAAGATDESEQATTSVSDGTCEVSATTAFLDDLTTRAETFMFGARVSSGIASPCNLGWCWPRDGVEIGSTTSATWDPYGFHRTCTPGGEARCEYTGHSTTTRTICDRSWSCQFTNCRTVVDPSTTVKKTCPELSSGACEEVPTGGVPPC
jgi:hypothetical protein